MIGHGGLFLCWKVIEEENLIKVRKNQKPTCSTARAALSVGHGGISAWDQRAGDFATHGHRFLDKGKH